MGMLLRRYHNKQAEQAEQAQEDLVNEVIEVDQEESTEDSQVNQEDQEDQEDQENKVGLEDKKVDELKELAKEAGVENYSKLKKSELIDELNSL